MPVLQVTDREFGHIQVILANHGFEVQAERAPSDARRKAERAAQEMATLLALEEGKDVARQQLQYEKVSKIIDGIVSMTGMSATDIWDQVHKRAITIRQNRVTRGPGAEY